MNDEKFMIVLLIIIVYFIYKHLKSIKQNKKNKLIRKIDEEIYDALMNKDGKNVEELQRKKEIANNLYEKENKPKENGFLSRLGKRITFRTSDKLGDDISRFLVGDFDDQL